MSTEIQISDRSTDGYQYFIAMLAESIVGHIRGTAGGQGGSLASTEDRAHATALLEAEETEAMELEAAADMIGVGIFQRWPARVAEVEAEDG